MNQAYRVTAMPSNEWKLPLNVAIAIHLLVILGAIYLPGIFKGKPKFADIYTVSIINIAEPTATPPSSPTKAQKVTPPPTVSTPPHKIPKAAPIAEPKEKVAPAPQKSISLKPLKKKKIEEVKPKETNFRDQEMDRKRRQKLAEAIREEQLLAEKAKLAQDALEAERKLYQSEQLTESRAIQTSPVSGNQTSASSASAGSSSNLLESQYLASIYNRLHQFWAPPEYLQQDPDLTAVVIITINLDGKIANTLFESKSGNRVFDQFVSKTLEDADPMPPIPPALKKQRFEIGLRFRPGSIQ